MSDLHRVTVTPAPDGARLDVEGFVRQTVTDVIALLAEHPELMDDLDRILTPGAPADPYKPERNLPTEALVDAVTSKLPHAIRVHGPALDALAGTLTTISRNQGGRPIGNIPGQRDGEVAA